WFSGLGTRSRRRCRRRLARERRRGVSLLVVFRWWFSGRRRMRRLARARRRGVSLLMVFLWLWGLRMGRRRRRRLARERRRGVSVSPSSSFQRFPILGLPFSSFKLLLFFVCWFSGLGTGSRRMRRLAPRRERRRSLSVSPSFSFQRFPVRRFSSLFFVWWLRGLRTRRRRRRLGCLARERQCCILGRHGFVVPKIKVGVA
ncbi:hypothetical protein B0H13DRAFT_2086382, partial [Mycena leptocephala]